MGLEGMIKLAVVLNWRLSKIYLSARHAMKRQSQTRMHGQALNGDGVGSDDVIDPAETRNWLVMGLDSLPPVPVRTHKKRGWIDTW